MLSLSGGNQQKVLLARALLNENVRLLLAEEPTQGVDVGARAEIYRILRQVADAGAAVVIVSSDIRELEGLCDRVAVFSAGHVVAELRGDRGQGRRHRPRHDDLDAAPRAGRRAAPAASGRPAGRAARAGPGAWLARPAGATTRPPRSWPSPSSPWPCTRRGTTPGSCPTST